MIFSSQFHDHYEFVVQDIFKKTAGAYQIQFGDWVYVGKSNDIRRRWMQWMFAIRTKKGLNDSFAQLLSSYKGIIHFSILEKIPKKKYTDAELSYLEYKYFFKYKVKNRKLLNKADVWKPKDYQLSDAPPIFLELPDTLNASE